MKVDLRSHIEKIVSLSDEEFDFVKSHFNKKEFKKNDFLIEKGNLVEEFFFVLSGLLKLTNLDDFGKEHIISFAMEDWWESDFQAFHTKAKATMSLQCIEDTSVLSLSLENYKSLCENIHKMEYFFLTKANLGHLASQQRILSFLSSSAKERYDQLLKKYPTLLQRVPKTLIASYLGVSRETLSRLYNS